MGIMYMPALDGALDKIEDYKKVNFIRSARNDKNKFFLVAGLSDGNSVQLTKGQSVLTYPFEPIASFSTHLGDFYCKHFVCMGADVMLNWHNLESLDLYKDEKGEKASVRADFVDGTSEELYRVNVSQMKVQEMKVRKVMSEVNALRAKTQRSAEAEQDDNQM